MRGRVENGDEDSIKCLKSLVEAFNNGYKKWRRITGHTATFGWGFSEGEKKLTVQEILRVIYIEPPSEEVLDEILSELKTEVESSFAISKD